MKHLKFCKAELNIGWSLHTGTQSFILHRVGVFSHSVMSNSLWPMDCSPPGSSVCGIVQQEYWSGLSFPTPGDLPDRGIELKSL